MKRAIKKKCGVYDYLNSTKVLETGSDQDIANARQEYWKAYKAEWRKRQRQETKEFTIVCTLSEAKDILEAARRHKRSRSKFIKESCLAYINKRYLVPDLLAMNSIRQQLAMNLNVLQKLFDESRIPYETGTVLLRQMGTLEKSVLTELHNPKTLEQWIIDTVCATPEYKGILIELLNKL